MKRSRIFGFIAIIFVILFIVSIFVPFYSSDYNFYEYSLWSGEHTSRIPFIVSGILMFLIFLVNIRTELAYLFSGFGFFFCLDQIIGVSDSYYGMEIFGAGFYLLFISSIIIIVLTFIMNFKVFSVKIGSKKEVVTSNDYQPVKKYVQETVAVPTIEIEKNEEIVGYHPKTGKPIVGYDPMTGEAIYKQENKEVNIVGYDPMTGKPIIGYDTKTGKPIYMEQ